MMKKGAVRHEYKEIVIPNQYSWLMKRNFKLTEELKKIKHSFEEKMADKTRSLNKQNKELIYNHKARSRLLANVAHDMGSPIEAIKTTLQLIIDEKGNGELDLEELLPQIIDKLTYIQQLNETIFDLSKLESGNIPLQLEKVKLKDFILGIYQSLQFDKHANNLSIYLDRVETMMNSREASIEIDRLRMMQVVQNYISNALKFTKSNQKVMTIRCYIREKHPQKFEVVLEFEDNGIGIPPDELQSIFTPFYRNSIVNEPGQGLGLAIVKEIIEQHGGEVGVNSKVGKGSTFYFSLPAL